MGLEVTLERTLLTGDEDLDDSAAAASLRSLTEFLREVGGSGECELGGR